MAMHDSNVLLSRSILTSRKRSGLTMRMIGWPCLFGSMVALGLRSRGECGEEQTSSVWDDGAVILIPQSGMIDHMQDADWHLSKCL